jgi:hypothetical protein
LKSKLKKHNSLFPALINAKKNHHYIFEKLLLRIVYGLPKILNQFASHQGFSLPINPIKAGKGIRDATGRPSITSIRERAECPLFWCIAPKKKGIISSTLSDRFSDTRSSPGGAFPPVMQGIRRTGL